jgi:hypothetical protein
LYSPYSIEQYRACTVLPRLDRFLRDEHRTAPPYLLSIATFGVRVCFGSLAEQLARKWQPKVFQHPGTKIRTNDKFSSKFSW